MTIIAIVTSIISGYYYIKVIKVIYFHPISINKTTGGSVSGNNAIMIAMISLVIIFFIISPQEIYYSIQVLSNLV